MTDYVKVFKDDNYVGLCFRNTDEKPFAIGEKMGEICAEAYMNGYNWEAFFNYYLAQNAPDLLDGLNSDPEADAYFANYKLTEENEKKAERFAEIIVSLIENEDELYRIVRENGDEIEWD